MKMHKHLKSKTHLTSFDMGELVPVGLTDVVQGDIWSADTSALIRLSPLLAPVLHPLYITIHHWFIPLRQLWTDVGGANTGFEAFITGGPDGTSAPTHPYMTMPNADRDWETNGGQ